MGSVFLFTRPVTLDRVLGVVRGGVATLTALSLRHCPLEFPPPPVVQQGLGAVLAFLRFCAVQRAPSGEPAPPALPALTGGKRSHRPPLLLGGPQESRPAGGAHSPEPRGTTGHLPPAETLDLSAPRPSAEPPEEWPSTEEIRRFWTLRQEIVGLEQAKILTNQLLAAELPPNLREALHTQKAARPVLPRVLRRKTRSFRGALPGLAASQPAVPGPGWLEESRASALRELREKQALLEQRRRDSRVLQEWRERTQTTRAREERLGKGPRPRRAPVASKAPFATDVVDNKKTPVNPPGKQRQNEEQALPAREERSTFRGGELEEKVKQHIRRTHEHRKRRRGAAPLEGIRKATGDPEIACGAPRRGVGRGGAEPGGPRSCHRGQGRHGGDRGVFSPAAGSIHPSHSVRECPGHVPGAAVEGEPFHPGRHAVSPPSAARVPGLAELLEPPADTVRPEAVGNWPVCPLDGWTLARGESAPSHLVRKLEPRPHSPSEDSALLSLLPRGPGASRQSRTGRAVSGEINWPRPVT
ncbi:leucine-rich repeat-containing protein 27 isoform X2 [Pteropus medius]|uniref:leucine-rich repeat-containing protein 27 isoform X2 n=1 Tax=Pteropus vampyrus TaxID=132908 RepID=UPI00196A5A07|nr:leucine-rich repeat-containing protein 27 isoform X2 [Pteropus giganteus]